VASMNDIGTSYRGDDVISLSSSRGPTPGGRRKPDITAPGSYITTTNAFWETSYDFSYWSGTSFAAPHVTGAVLLLMDYLGPPVEPERIKALLLNNADKWGSTAWNRDYGWGYLNMLNVWNRRDDSYLAHVAPQGNSGDYDLFRATIDADNRSATLVWHRHVDYASGGNYPSTWYSLNDLDLILYDHAGGSVLDVAASGIDNVEQVWHAGACPIECVIRVEAADTSFSAVSQEEYGLAGPPELFFPPDLPQIEVAVSTPYGTTANSVYKVAVTLRNAGDFNAITPSVQLAVPPLHTILQGGSVQIVPTLIHDLGNRVTAHWTVRAGPGPGPWTLTATATSDCWGEIWNGSGEGTLRCLEQIDPF